MEYGREIFGIGLYVTRIYGKRICGTEIYGRGLYGRGKYGTVTSGRENIVWYFMAGEYIVQEDISYSDIW